MNAITVTGAAFFDGSDLKSDGQLSIADGRVAAAPSGNLLHPEGDYLLPGLLDLQVSGGGGHQFSGRTTAADISMVCKIHARLGALSILPTLITGSAEATAAFIAAGFKAAKNGCPGFLALHLEGPHLDPRRTPDRERSFRADRRWHPCSNRDNQDRHGGTA